MLMQVVASAPLNPARATNEMAFGGKRLGARVSQTADGCESRSGGFREPHAAVRGFKARGCEGSHEREMHAPREGW